MNLLFVSLIMPINSWTTTVPFIYAKNDVKMDILGAHIESMSQFRKVFDHSSGRQVIQAGT